MSKSFNSSLHRLSASEHLKVGLFLTSLGPEERLNVAKYGTHLYCQGCMYSWHSEAVKSKIIISTLLTSSL